jgi:hypothetical protein
LRKIGQEILPSVLYGAKKMNMISTGAFLDEVDTTRKQDDLVSKLVSAWEKKNSKTARAGGVSLMALSLAACGSSDSDDAVTYSLEQMNAAKVVAKQEGVDSVDITSNDAAISSAATLAAASAAASTALTVKAAADSALAVLQASYDSLSTSNTALQATYDALVAPKALVFTTGVDSLVGGSGSDTVTAAAGTVAATDAIIDTSTTDADTLTIVSSAAPGAFTSTNIETIDITINNLGAIAVDAANYTGVTGGLTVTRGDVVVGGSVLTGNKAVQVTNTDAATMASITVGAGTTTVNIDSASTDKAGHVINADIATGNVTVDGAATINAAASTGTVAIDAVSNTTAAETVKASIINAANAGTVTSHADLTGSVTINAAKATTITVNDAQGGATIVGGTPAADTTITVVDVDASGASITAGTGADDSTTATNIGLDITIDGTTLATDAATISAAGHVELDIDGTNAGNVDIITLSGNGAGVVYDLAAPATGTAVSFTKAGTQSVEIMGDISEFTAITVTDINTIDIIAGTAAAFNGASYSGVGKIDLGINNTNNAATLVSGSTLEVTIDQTTGLDIDFSAAGGGDVTIVAGDDNGASSAVGTITVAALNAAAAAATTVGTVTLEASIANLTATSTVIGAKQNLVITGDENVTLGAVTADSVSAVNSSGIMNMTAAGNVDTVALGSGNDVLIANDTGTTAKTLSTGAGNDTITLTAMAATSTLDAGAGNDTINADEVDVVVMIGGAGNDNFATAAALAGTIVGGDGTDTITIDGAGALTMASTFAFSGISELDITAANAAVSITGAQLANNATLIIDGNAAADVFNVNTGSTTAAAKSADLSNVTIKTGATASITVTGNVGVDTITGGVAAETFTQTLKADTIAGGGGTAVDTYVGVNGLDEAGASPASAGTVYNLGDTAVTSATVASNTTATAYIAGGLASIAAGSVGYIYTTNATTNSSVVDTVSGIENITGSAGIDYVVGTSGNNSISTLGGADYITGGAGADTIRGGLAADVILLGSGDAVGDDVIIDSGLTIDSVSHFETGVDDAQFDLSALETTGASIAANTHNLIDGDGTDITTSTTMVIQAIAGASVLGSTATILNYTAATAADAAALETALEAGGGILTTDSTAGVTADDAILAMYDNGTNIMLAIIEFSATVATTTKIAAVDVVDVMSLTGITADLVAGDFEIIA